MDRIAFVTDLHIDNDSTHTLGINTQKNFEATLKYIKSREYNSVVLGGDLCNKMGESFIYAYVKEKMEELGLPYFYIAGNHDDSQLLANVMDHTDRLVGDELYFKNNTPQGSMFFLDTSKGIMSETQWNWLMKEIESVDESFVTLFMHHPPIKAYSKHMEPRYQFKEFEKFEQLTKHFKNLVFSIFTGHYHMEKTIIKDNIRLFVSPSTYIQIDPDFDSFQPVFTGPMFREIILSDVGQVSTRIVHAF